MEGLMPIPRLDERFNERECRVRDFGARLMLETLVLRYNFYHRTVDDLWDAYVARLRAEREQAIRYQFTLTRFAMVERAGRDADWIRSFNKFGIPPVPD
jgi:hypothetical protein